MIRLFIFTLLSLFLYITNANAYAYVEKVYQNYWCAGKGQAEVVLPDNTRCDCITPTHSIEVDYASKFYEAIGQSLYYSFQTSKRAGILLIIESATDEKYWLRLNSTIQHFNLPIDTWRIAPADIK